MCKKVLFSRFFVLLYLLVLLTFSFTTAFAATSLSSKGDYSAVMDLGSNNSNKDIIEFDVTPLQNGINGIISIVDSSDPTPDVDITTNTAAGWYAIPILFRMQPTGLFDARNGGSYTASNAVAYTANKKYHVVITAKFAAGTFTAEVDGVKVADNFAFRSGSNPINDFGKLYATSIVDNLGANDLFKVENVVLKSTSTSLFSKGDYSAVVDLGANNTNKNIIDFDVTPLQNGINGIISIVDSNDPTPDVDITTNTAAGWYAIPVLFRMQPTGLFDARNGGSYTASNSVAYTANTKYHVKITADFTAGTYTAEINGVKVADNFAFRSGANPINDFGKLYATSIVDNLGANDLFKIDNVVLSASTVIAPVATATPVPVATATPSRVATATPAPVATAAPSPTPIMVTKTITTETFYKGINLNGLAVKVDGYNWLSYKEALSSGFTVNKECLTFAGSGTYTTTPPNKNMMDTCIYVWASDGNGNLASGNLNLNLSQKIENGTYNVYLWVLENYQDNFRSFNLKLENKLAGSNLGKLPLNTWKKIGPYPVTVSDGVLNIDMIRVTGDVALQGLAIFKTATTTTTVAVDPDNSTPSPNTGDAGLLPIAIAFVASASTGVALLRKRKQYMI